MQPPPIVLVPWVIALLMELWLIYVLFKRGLNRQYSTFTAMLVIHWIVDLAVLSAALTRVHTYELYTLRQICNSVLRSWVLFELCQHLLASQRWTRIAMITVLIGSAVLLVGGGYSLFHQDSTILNGTYRQAGVWFRTAYFAQIGVVAALFLMTFRSSDATQSRDFGIAIGLGTASGAELVSFVLREHADVASRYAFISLNYIGLITAVAIWLMFMTANFPMRTEERTPTREMLGTAK